MPTRAHVGVCALEDAVAAGREAAQAAVAPLPGGRADLALVFATSDYQQHALIDVIQSAIPDARVLGCSGEGVIAQDESLEASAAVAVMAIASTSIRFDTFVVDEYALQPTDAGKRLGQMVKAQVTDPKCPCILSDGLMGNCTDFLKALHDEMGSVPIVGGTAADAMSFEQTYQYAGNRVLSGGVVAFAISGVVDVEIAVSHGCAPIGLERTVTHAENGWIREIDGIPAWQLFKEYLASDAEDLNADGISHLCIGEPIAGDTSGYDPYVIRTPLQLDKASGELFFPGGGLTEGNRIHLTRRDPDKIKRSAQACAERVLDSHNGDAPAFVLQFDCAGRGRILFGACTAAEIVVPLRKTLGPTTPWLGFHTYGEIAPIAGRPYYHNYTVALCAVYDRAA